MCLWKSGKVELVESDFPLSSSCSSEGRTVEEPVKVLSAFGEQFLEAIWGLGSCQPFFFWAIQPSTSGKQSDSHSFLHFNFTYNSHRCFSSITKTPLEVTLSQLYQTMTSFGCGTFNLVK